MSRPFSSILFETADRSVVVVDLPRSIEEVQDVIGIGDGDVAGIANSGRQQRCQRLISTPAPTEPFDTPRGSDTIDYAAGRSLAGQLAELTTRASVESALRELKTAAFDGPWCLPRCLSDHAVQTDASEGQPDDPLIPPGARYLDGTIADRRDEFLAAAPEFDVIVMDPPWPNRSARRRRQGRKRKRSALDKGEDAEVHGTDSGYDTASDMAVLRDILGQIPVGAKLARSGIVAVWVTNKPACEALLTDAKHGLFRTWGVELVATWTWVKVTSSGEPIVAMDAQWRKPWERLLLARRPAGNGGISSTALPAHRVIVGVPDVHSRKPHLKPLLAPFLPSFPASEIRGLEIFARNLTSGWWAWGNEVLLFQHPSWWTTAIEPEEAVVDTK
ncbi:MT-a70 family protein [Sporothrix schenckii 1099-18]|uniref:MT-a70 family protein n=1 Tax=Sporothrix schenckii 1099-18 TaxID=1397361 RepID=A0A0F2LZJ7_SPOSC|nr:MT-a70 family protein [Sporothrix schenckii 1099-18]KJR82254.1 MT-a70 family protein [Sporothrix schenckii 1099-18]